MTEQEAALFAMQDEIAKFVAGMTGAKAQFVEAGWSETNAELLVIEMFRNAKGQQ